MSVVWQLHRDDFDAEANTVRGVLNGKGNPGNEILTLPTVENLGRRIPAGRSYLCKLDWWYRGELPDVRTYEIIWPDDLDGDGLPDRDRLLFHWANAVRGRDGKLDLLGCVAPGLELVDDVWETFFPEADLPALARRLPGIADSRRAFGRFMSANDGLSEFVLKVTETL